MRPKFDFQYSCEKPLVCEISDPGESKYCKAQSGAEVQQDSHADHTVDPGDGQQETQCGDDCDVDEGGHVFSSLCKTLKGKGKREGRHTGRHRRGIHGGEKELLHFLNYEISLSE